MCKKEFNSDDEDDDDDDDGNKKYYKVRDHCHYIGKFRGAIHNIFNLTYKTPKEITVVFHNGSTYDHNGSTYDLIQLIFQCLEYKKNYKKDFNKESIKRFANTYEFCNGDINKFILLLRKAIYSYEYMDSWEIFDETSLPDKKAFYSELNLEDITDKDYAYAQKVFKELKLKNLGDYHDLYV